MKSKEASDLHMDLKHGLSLFLDSLDAVVDSLILNVNEDSHILLLDKAKCVQWFLSNKLDSLSRFHLCILDQQIMKTTKSLGHSQDFTTMTNFEEIIMSSNNRCRFLYNLMELIQVWKLA